MKGNYIKETLLHSIVVLWCSWITETSRLSSWSNCT